MKNKISRIVILTSVVLLAGCLIGTLDVASATPYTTHRNIAVATNGGGYVTDWTNTQGEADGNYATLYTYNYGDTSIIIGQMNDWAIGNIWVRCSNYWGASSAMLVYVANSPTGPWNWVGSLTITSSSLQWQQITNQHEPGYPAPPGYSPGSFLYIALCCTSPSNGISNHVYVDAVAADPFYY